jgi:hypothetical protein
MDLWPVLRPEIHPMFGAGSWKLAPNRLCGKPRQPTVSCAADRLVAQRTPRVHLGAPRRPSRAGHRLTAVGQQGDDPAADDPLAPARKMRIAGASTSFSIAHLHT